jgi:hypothetical protein
MLRQLWFDESGFILSAEFIIIATILVIGLVAGLSSVRAVAYGVGSVSAFWVIERTIGVFE